MQKDVNDVSHSYRITCDIGAVSLFENREQLYIKAIKHNNHNKKKKKKKKKKKGNNHTTTTTTTTTILGKLHERDVDAFKVQVNRFTPKRD